MGLFFKNPMIPHPLRRKRGAESCLRIRRPWSPIVHCPALELLQFLSGRNPAAYNSDMRDLPSNLQGVAKFLRPDFEKARS